MPLSPDDSRPPYLQIAEALRTAIHSGEFTPGSQLPSGADLSVRYGVARNTVRSALRLLTDEGLIVTRPGSGVFVRSTITPENPPASDASRIDAVLHELGEIRQDVRQLKQRVSDLEGQLQETRQHS